MNIDGVPEGFELVEEITADESISQENADIPEGFEFVEEVEQLESIPEEVEKLNIQEPKEDKSDLIKSKKTNFDKGIFKMAEREAYDKYKETGKIDLELLPEEEKPNFLTDKIFRLARGVLNTAKGGNEFMNMIELVSMNNALDMFSDADDTTKEAILKTIKTRQDIGTSGPEAAISKLGENIRTYDSENITDDIASGNYAQAADRVIGGIFESAPSLALAYTGLGGLMLLGVTSAGNKFKEELEQNPEESLNTIALNSILSGTAEAAFERVTMGILGRAKSLIGTGNKKAAEELLSSYSNQLLKRFSIDPLKEGVSEAATEFTVDLIDAATLDKGFDINKQWKQWVDAGLIGYGSGVGIVSTNALKNTKESIRNAAEYKLTPEIDKQVMQDAAKNINTLSQQLREVDNESDAEIISSKIADQEQLIIDTKKRVSEELNLMNNEELVEYANNKDKIDLTKRKLNSKFSVIKEDATQNLYDLELQNEALIREAVDRRLNENIKTVGVKDLGRTVNDYKSKEEYQKAYDNTEEGKKNSINVTSSDGFISEDGDIYINREVAQKVRNVNVAAHELLHGILNNNIKEPGQLKKLVNEFKAILPKDIADRIQKRIDDNYRFETDEQGNRVERPESEYMEEYFTAFADLIGNRQVKFNENIFTKIGDKLTPIFKGKGYGHIKFDSGKDVYNFIRDYQKQIAKGELAPETIEAAKKIAEQDVKMSKTSSDKVQEIYTSQGTAGALDIIQEFKPIVNKIVQRRSEAPGFDRQLLTDEIETGERGILDLIQAYDPKSNVPLAAYINKFLPSRAIEASKRVLGEVFEGDISERVDIAEPTTAVQEVEITKKPKAPTNLRRALDIKEGSDLYNKVKDVVAKTFGTRIPEVTDPKFKKTLQDTYATELTSDVKELMGKPSSDKYKTFLQKYGEQIYDLIPQDILNKSYQDFIVEEKKNLSPTQVDNAISEGLLPADTPRTAGPSLFTKKPYNQEEFVEFHLAPKKGRPASKQTQLAQTIAKELGKDATLEVLEDPKVFERFNEVQEIQGREVTKETKPKVAEKIQRKPNVKFSLSSKKAEELNIKGDKLRKGFEKNVNQILTNNPTISIDEAIELELKKIGKNRGFAYENVIIERLKKLKIKGFKVSDQAGGNKVGIPDFAALIFGNSFDVEVKLAKAQYGDVGLIYRNGKINFNSKVQGKPYTFKEEIKKLLINPAYKAIRAYRKRAGELGADLQLYDRTGKLPMEIYLQLGEGLTAKKVADLKPKYNYLKEKYPNGIKGEGLQKAITQKAEFDISPVKEIYENKVPPTSYIQLKGSGLFFMGKNPLRLPIPELTGNVDLSMRVMASNNIGSDGIPMTTVNLRILPSGLRNIPKSSYTLDDASSMSSLLNTDAVKILETKIPAKESNIKELSSVPGAKFSKSVTNDEVIGYAKTVDEALANARKLNASVKKIRVFDFDDTLAQTKSIVFYTNTDGTEGQLTAEEFAEKGADLVAQGAVMDFSDFNIVRDGKRGPLFNVAKKIRDARGNEDLFVLTARAPESADAIYEFLKSEGLEFKRENIIGLGNSTGAAKANWIVGKAAEGYNDFYFADDAFGNVQAVQDVLDQIDVKSKVQQAKVKFSKSINEDFNKIIEQKTGIASEKRYSKAKAKVRGAGKGNKKFFIPYSAEDFMGLIYPLLSKGKLGDSQMAWFKEHLLNPYGRAIENLSRDRIQMMQDFRELKKSLEVPKDLRKTNDSGFTNEQAVRVYLFNKMGYDIPGLSKSDLSELVDIINADGKLKAFADQILSVTKGDGYVKPSQDWLSGTITTDLIDLLNTTKRRKYLEKSGYLDNANEIFNEENLNKLEAAYGANYREAVENILARMKSGKNRMFSGSRLSNRVLDYINGSIGTIMFFNTRSAVLQTISSINFLNWSFNNPIKAGKAFANQKQYWKDFKMLMNSDYLTDRRNGLKLNISENEIANAAATAKNRARGAMNYILQKGYLPTQFADSFAIASGGATFYRNRVNDLVKQGLDIKEAEQQALSEWKETAEISQQSSDPSKISQQQASDLGRVILAFANTPMQYARIQKRAAQDLINRRGDAKANVSKIIYYGVVQNLIFNALQQAIFAIGFGDDDDEKNEKKYFNTANGMLDSLLRGVGIAGATTAVIKNFLLDVYERSGRKRPEYVDAVYKLLQLSPPISSKISKIRQAAYQFDSKKRRQEVFDKGFSIDNPAYEAAAKVISATTNLPLDRLINKANNIEAAVGEDAETWQRVAMLAGWPEWQIMPKDKKQEELPRYPGRRIKKPSRKIKKSSRKIKKI